MNQLREFFLQKLILIFFIKVQFLIIFRPSFIILAEKQLWCWAKPFGEIAHFIPYQYKKFIETSASARPLGIFNRDIRTFWFLFFFQYFHFFSIFVYFRAVSQVVRNSASPLRKIFSFVSKKLHARDKH